jgi:hypothetical protein
MSRRKIVFPSGLWLRTICGEWIVLADCLIGISAYEFHLRESQLADVVLLMDE